MHKVNSSPVKYVVLPESNSLLAINDPTQDMAYLLHRVDILTLDNQQLRQSQQQLKKLNAILTDALANRNSHSEDIKSLIKSILNDKPENRHETESNKNLKHQDQQTEDPRNYESPPKKYAQPCSQQNPEEFPSPSRFARKLEFILPKRESPGDRIHRDEIENSQFCFQKTKTPQAQSNRLSISSFDKMGSLTPCHKPKLTTSGDHFQKSLSFFDKSITHRSVSRSANRNVATDLLCDICGQFFPPMEFLSHVQQCEGEGFEQTEDDVEIMKITDLDNLDDQDDGSEELLLLLENRKRKLSNQIDKLKRLQDSPDRKRRLETDLDQIVFIIKNRRVLKKGDIKRLLKEKNHYEKCFQ